MKMHLKKAVVVLFLTGSVAAANADVCNTVPGSITCGNGTVKSLTGNGMVTVNGTTVSGTTLVNGLLNAKGANFYSLEVNGNAKLTQCTINHSAHIKGSLTASSTKFDRKLELNSGQATLINSKVRSDLHLAHTDSKKQIVYLDDFSEVSGNIIFDDGEGEVILRGQSKIGGKVIGGRTVLR